MNDENERLASIETKIDMHLVECTKTNNNTSTNIKNIYSDLGLINKKLDLSLYKQDQHSEKHKLQDENYFKIKLAIFIIFSTSLFSLLVNFLV